MREDITRSIIMEGFYGKLINDFIDNGDQSVIYRYLYDNIINSAQKYDAGSAEIKARKADYIFSEYFRLGKRPKKKELEKFGGNLIEFLSENHILYDYHDKRLTESEDIEDICLALKPFIPKEKKNLLLNKKKDDESVIKKTRINRILKESVTTLDKADFGIRDVEKLMKHVTDRIICKAFDDFLYNAGFGLIDTEKQEGQVQYEVFGDEKGRKDKKGDKLLDLIYRYYLKYGVMPFDDCNISNPGYRGICEELYVYLSKLLKSGDKAANKVSVPIASDSFTGCSLQLIGNYYYSSEELKDPFAYAIMERRAEEGAFVYEYYDDESECRLYTDIEKAAVEYSVINEEIREDIISLNSEFVSIKHGKLKDIPVMFKYSFGEEEEEDEEILDETRGFINKPYKREKGDVGYIPNI